MRGSLHCAAHDEAVNGFGRDDGVWVGRGGNENARNPKGLWRLILEDLPACRPSSSPAQPCGQPAAFTADRPFSPASEPDPPAPVRLPRPRPGFAVDRRLAPPPDPPALPQKPGLRSSSVGASPAWLSGRPTACAADRPFALPLNSTYCVRLSTCVVCRSLFAVIPRLGLPVDLRLAPPINLPAPPSELILRLYRLLCLRPALQPTFGLRLGSTIPLCLRTRHPALTGCRILSSAFRSTFGLRRRSTFPLRLRNSTLRPLPVVASPARLSGRPPAFACGRLYGPCLRIQRAGSHRLLHLRLGPPVDLRLSPGIDLPAPPSNSTSDELRRHQLRRTLGLAGLCMQVQIGSLMCILAGAFWEGSEQSRQHVPAAKAALQPMALWPD